VMKFRRLLGKLRCGACPAGNNLSAGVVLLVRAKSWEEFSGRFE